MKTPTRRVSLGPLLLAALQLAPACASRLEGAKSAFVYRVVEAREARGSCEATSGSPIADATPFFVVIDGSVTASAIACASEAECDVVAARRSVPPGTKPAWRVPLASFVFVEDTPPAGGPCRGVGTTVRSNGAGASPFVLAIADRHLEGIARLASDGTCSVEQAASLAEAAPCTASRRFVGELVSAR